MKLDPRTKLFILALTGIITFLNESLEVELLLVALPLLLQCFAKRYRKMLNCTLTFVVLMMIQLFLVPKLPLLTGGVIYMFSMYIRKLIPCFILGDFLIATTQVSKFMAAVYKMKVPKNFAIALSITFRYFPVMSEEWGLIKEAMMFRGLNTSFTGMLRRPIKTMEYVYVPMLVSASKISDEITQAAITRGIDHICRRTCIETVEFSIQDVSVVLVYTAIVVLWRAVFV